MRRFRKTLAGRPAWRRTSWVPRRRVWERHPLILPDDGTTIHRSTGTQARIVGATASLYFAVPRGDIHSGTRAAADRLGNETVINRCRQHSPRKRMSIGNY
jgi:hypothetical protein